MTEKKFSTPTGRLVYDDPFTRRIQEAIDRFDPRTDDQGRRVIVLGGDYSQLEAYILGALIRDGEASVVLELGQSGGQIASILDESCIFRGIQPKKPAIHSHGSAGRFR